MRLSSVLSKSPKYEYVQVDGFLQNKKGIIGQQVLLSVGDVMLNYYCSNCGDMRTFISKGQLSCIFVDRHIISIDCVMACNCGQSVQIWFLVECDDDICGYAPNVRILKRSEKLSNLVKTNDNQYGELSLLLEKAERARREELGAGSIVYLRKVFEMITAQMAEIMNIPYQKHKEGNPKNFRTLLEKVDSQCQIIPKEFSKDGYKLFRELSLVLHGEYNEELGLKKFDSLLMLVKSILDNVNSSRQLKEALSLLGWEDTAGDE